MTNQQPSADQPHGLVNAPPDPFGLTPTDPEMDALRALVQDAAEQHAPDCDCGCGDKADMTEVVSAVVAAIAPEFGRLREQLQDHQVSGDYQVGWDHGVLACTQHHARRDGTR